MRRRFLFLLLLNGLIASLAFAAQTSHRLDPKSREAPNEFETMKKRGDAPGQGSNAALEQQRKANLDELQRELPLLIGLAQELQNRLKSVDPNAVLPADLHKESKDLEGLAHQIRKRVSGL
jgi:hypothetical protein